MAENVAHFYISQALERIASGRHGAAYQVLVLDSVRAVFPRDLFLTKTIGLSVFCEGPMRIGESATTAIGWDCSCHSTSGGYGTRGVNDGAARGALPILRVSIAGCSSNWSAARSCSRSTR